MKNKVKGENANNDKKMNSKTSANTNGIENNKNIEKSTGENCKNNEVIREEVKDYLIVLKVNNTKDYGELWVDDIPRLDKDFIINTENNSNENNKENNGCVDGENNKNSNKDTIKLENFKGEFDYIFIVESPYKDEVENHCPLFGKSGKEVSKYLFGEKYEKVGFGELVNENNKVLNGKKIAIVNVSNMPLQDVKYENCKVPEEIITQLGKIRDNSISENTIGSQTLYKMFEKKLEKYLKEANEDCYIVLCGEFVTRYFNKYLEDADKDLLLKFCKNELKRLFVPHPSRNQWTFINKHKDDLTLLKENFNNIAKCDNKI